ncbi:MULTISPECIES: helix-turn-helix transcriptional regulator [Paenibacillus]|uniref:HTH-type transcriptional regulator YisR n=1 Tax=Paenibacillus albilobatus TaxID=2716884 RepID=A0A920C9M7_9BACL|nr:MULTISPECIES: AraC family transcriptional regulator [Paenibacillus]GIO31270.1 putative HTH-type transcriptional regulator YisR [Paenibacillus albilobatus]
MFHFVSPPLPHYVSCGEDTYPPGGTHPDRSGIGVFDLLVVTSGCLYLEEEGSPLHIASGHYGILRPDRSHRTAEPCRTETHFYWLHFHTLGSWNASSDGASYWAEPEDTPYARIEKFSIYIPRTGKLEPTGPAGSAVRRIMLLNAEQSAKARWDRQILLQDLLSALQYQGGEYAESPHVRVAERAGEFLRRHYKEHISYQMLSESLHFHPNYISLCMKKTFDCTPLEYLTRYRIEQAKRMLIHTDEPIGRIAELAGFRSFPYFVRCFARNAGQPPNSFRKLFRK